MEKYMEILSRCTLFDRIAPSDLVGLLTCLGGVVHSYPKGSTVWSEGDPAHLVGIVLEGGVQILKEDLYGNRNIMSNLTPGELFGESFAAAGLKTLPVSVIATRDSKILLIACHRITTGCCNACGFHTQLIHNLLRVVAQRNLQYNQKLEIIAKRTTREKLMAYLMTEAKIQGARQFTIPFNRQELADYLGVERSAMSAEISKLRADGVITCEKSLFTIL